MKKIPIQKYQRKLLTLFSQRLDLEKKPRMYIRDNVALIAFHDKKIIISTLHYAGRSSSLKISRLWSIIDERVMRIPLRHSHNNAS